MDSEKKPFFSVVIPLYDKASHVKETIQTVLDQTFQDFEIIVVNDGSKDESAQIVESIEENRLKIFHQENQGVSVARNRAIKEARADYIAFLDADDLWLPHFLETIYNLIQKFPAAGFYITSFKLMNKKKEYTNIDVKAILLKDYVGLIPYLMITSNEGNIAWTSASCIPKKIFEKNDIWFPVGEKYGEDSHVWMRVASLYDVAYDDKICSIYCIETDNNTLKTSVKEKEPCNSILILKDYRDIIRDIEKIKYFDKYIENHISGTILRNILNGDKIYAFNQIFKYDISFILKLKLLLVMIFPKISYEFLKKIKRKIRKFL